jgi:hypothetical protein
VGIAALIEGGVPQELGVPIIGTVPAMYELSEDGRLRY